MIARAHRIFMSFWIAAALALALSTASAAARSRVSPLPRSDYGVRAVCHPPAPGRAACQAYELVPRTAEARAHTHPLGVARALLATPSSPPTPAGGNFGFRPQDLHSAYQLPATASKAQTVALVDAYNDLSAEEDLATYAKEFSLPECTTAGGCFEKVNQNGETGNLPFPKSAKELETARKGLKASREEAEEATGWAFEISLDIEVTHAVCESCHIVLVEANTPSFENLEKAEHTAISLGASEISNSFAGSEQGETTEREKASPFNHPGVVITASAGDDGYLNWDSKTASQKGFANFPSSSPHVVAVGGTRLSITESGAWASEAVWDGDGAGGGGCSSIFTAQPWQQSVSDWSSVGCGSKRAVADVAADADPYTGVAIYDSGVECEYEFKEGNVRGHWCTVGGTSLASPLIASTFALAGGANGVEYPARTLYEGELKSPSSLHDVTQGSNGECTKPFTATGLSGCTAAEEAEHSCKSEGICLAESGYDGPTGVGTPAGLADFETSSATPPAVITGPASGVSQTTATLSAEVNPNGAEVSECKLEYGPTASYGTSVPCNPTPGSGTNPVAVTASLSGLTANTTYHYRVVATNIGGTSTGKDTTFKTLPNPPTVTTGPASGISQTTATLNAEVNPNGAEVSECKLEYGPTVSYGSSAPCNPSPGSGSSPVAVTASLSGLTANTTYHYRVLATNPGGTSTGKDTTFKTLPNPPTVITGPASGVSQTTATLNAEVNPNGAEVSECKLEYGPTVSYGSSAPCNPSPGSGSSPVSVTASLSGLTANTTYHYRVTATNPGGTSTGKDTTFKTLPNPPTVITGPASGVSQTVATLNAEVNPNGAEVSECKLEYGPTASYGSSAPCNPSPGSGSSPVSVTASLSGLTANTTYHYRVTATNPGGTTTGKDTTFKTLPNPPTVTTGPASGVSQTTATLSAEVNPNGAEVSECKLEYGPTASYGSSAPCSPSPGSGSSPVAVTASLSGLTANTSYHYRIVATNTGGTSTGKDTTFKTLPNPPAVITRPASGVSQTAATLNAEVNPNGAEVSECKLEYGSTASYGSNAPCNPSPGSGSSPVGVSASLSGLTPSTTYHYRVVATNLGGVSYGADETVTTLAAPPEFGRCVKVARGKGKYASSNCTRAGESNSYEWDPGVPDVTFTTLASVPLILETSGGSRVTCAGATSTGLYTGAKQVGEVLLRLTGCERSGEPCSSGLASGEIVSMALEGVLGVEKLGTTSSTDKIGIDLFAAGNAGPVMEFSCGITTVSIHGSVIVGVTANKMALTQALKSRERKGKQQPESFVGGSRDVLEASFDNGAPEQVGLTLTSTQTSKEAVEVNSVL